MVVIELLLLVIQQHTTCLLTWLERRQGRYLVLVAKKKFVLQLVIVIHCGSCFAVSTCSFSSELLPCLTALL